MISLITPILNFYIVKSVFFAIKFHFETWGCILNFVPIFSYNLQLFNDVSQLGQFLHLYDFKDTVRQTGLKFLPGINFIHWVSNDNKVANVVCSQF
jgi:hypothetical protein